MTYKRKYTYKLVYFIATKSVFSLFFFTRPIMGEEIKPIIDILGLGIE